MVLLGGLELVAGAYIIKKHQENKRTRRRLSDEAASLSESKYPLFPEDERHRPLRRHRSSSRKRSSSRRHSRERHPRPHSATPDHKYRHDSPLPKPILKPGVNYSNAEIAAMQEQEQERERMQMHRPPPYHAAGSAPTLAVPGQAPYPHPQQYPPPPPQQQQQQQYPQDVKYGWTDQHAQQQQRPAQDPDAPPTGWPVEWQNSTSSSAPGPQRQRGEVTRDRSRDDSRLRFSRGRRRADSFSPPPSYRA